MYELSPTMRTHVYNPKIEKTQTLDNNSAQGFRSNYIVEFYCTWYEPQLNVDWSPRFNYGQADAQLNLDTVVNRQKHLKILEDSR